MNNFRPPFFYPPHYPHYFNNYKPYRSVQKNNKPQELLPTTSNSDNVKSNLEDEKKCDEHTKKRHPPDVSFLYILELWGCLFPYNCTA